MFKQIKALRDESSDTAAELAALKDEMQALRNDISEDREQMAELRNLQADYVAKFEQNLGKLQILNNDIEKELRQFRALQSELSRKLMEKLEQELALVVVHAKEKLTSDVNKSRQLQDSVDMTARQLSTLQNTVARLVDVASGIKKEDFSLSKSISELKKTNEEKIQLMQEVDKLKSMIGKMKQAGRSAPLYNK